MTRATEHRRQARESALQMLYEWEVGGSDLDVVVATSWAIQARPLDVARDAMAGRLVRGTVAHLHDIDAWIDEAASNWRIERLAVIDRLILRMGAYELAHETETPHAVVISEAVELAKRFSAADAPKFINGVLDAIRRRLEERANTP